LSLTQAAPGSAYGNSFSIAAITRGSVGSV
jgi:hypothetical protein